MRLARFLTISAFAISSAVGFQAAAQELDNEASVTNQQIEMSREIPATLVIRTNAATNEVQVLHTGEKLAADSATAANLTGFAKVAVDSTMTGGELDQDSSRSSWYFCFNGWQRPTYYYYGYSYSYTPYYSYYYAGYNYSYYRWSYGWWY